MLVAVIALGYRADQRPPPANRAFAPAQVSAVTTATPGSLGRSAKSLAKASPTGSEPEPESSDDDQGHLELALDRAGIVNTEGDIDLEIRDYYAAWWASFEVGPLASPFTIRWATTTAGSPVVDIADVAKVAAQAFADPRGWSLRGALRFEHVASTEDADLVLMLAEAAAIADYSADCLSWQTGLPDASCSVGALVIINDLRWRDGALGDPIPLDLFHIHEINHETGHWLGQGHFSCLGGAAAVNQQQFRSLDGCTANAWPLPWEQAMVAQRYAS